VDFSINLENLALDLMASSSLAGAFYENDFGWEEMRDERIDSWEKKPIAVATLRQDEGGGELVWNGLYKVRGDGMFKARRYIIEAFPELREALDAEGSLSIADIGCGAGATLLPILSYRARGLSILATDISCEALDLLTASLSAKHEDILVVRSVDAENDLEGKPDIVYNERIVLNETTTTIHTMPWDLTAPLPQLSVSNRYDIGLLIFTLSAIPPEKQLIALRNATSLLKSGGKLLIRDYGAFDMIQDRTKLRIGEWTVQKEDGVFCTFYTLETLTHLFTQAGLTLLEPPRYCTVKNVNRKQNSEIRRVFIRAVGIKNS